MDTPARTTLEAGAGRPFRFSLVLEDGRGTLRSWIGGKWAFFVGSAGVLLATGAATLAAAVASSSREVETPAFASVGAAIGALLSAWHLRPRSVHFLRRDGGWWWRGPGLFRRGWKALTEESPLRLEREILSTVEGFALYAGDLRILSYLGDPVIGRRVGLAFQAAGVPLRTVHRRRAPAEDSDPAS